MHIAHTISCQVYPSEYAFRDDSVNRDESASANCRRYTISDNRGTIPYPSEYIHCDGTQLQLTDSNLGQENYQKSEYYQWPAGSDKQLLFIFPANVSLTTITLHYYSDSNQGLPRLRFYAVPDDFGIWMALATDHLLIDVASIPPGREPAGHRNVSIDINFKTTEILHTCSDLLTWSHGLQATVFCTHAQ